VNETEASDGALDDFLRVDMRVGRVLEVTLNERAKLPAYVMRIDFGLELGVKLSSAQLTENYTPGDLVGRLVVAVCNLGVKRVAGVKSEVLVLGAVVAGGSGTRLLGLDRAVEPGTRVS